MYVPSLGMYLHKKTVNLQNFNWFSSTQITMYRFADWPYECHLFETNLSWLGIEQTLLLRQSLLSRQIKYRFVATGITNNGVQFS